MSLKPWLFAISALTGFTHGAQICSLVFDQCPGNFTSGTITVPQSVIWLDPVVPVCTENVQIVTGSQAAPSLVFIIDNSGSMGGDLGNGTDPQAQRFKVPPSLLDSIFRFAPNTEVGLVIFSRRLAFDDRDNPFFKPAFPGDATQHDAYVPLTKLNQVFANGRTGLDTLKALLSTAPNSNGNLIYNTKYPESRPNKDINNDPNGTVPDPAAPGKWNFRDGTDITLGFQAAKQAIAAATAPKDGQFFIFLSDGAPSSPDDSRAAQINDFVAGTNVPTTFTVYFNNGRDVPQTIANMTNNIKANAYSASNAKSAYFGIDTRLDQLLPVLQNSVINPIFSNAAGQPESAVMSVVGGKNYPSTSVDAKNFTFGDRVPLSTDQTVVNLNYVYTYTDSGKTKRKEVPYKLTVKRAAAGTELKDGLSSSCQDQGAIALYNKGAQVNIVTADHENLDVRLTLSSGEACNGCSVEVKPSKSTDRETVALSATGGYHQGSFGRETSTQVKANDGKLEHLPTDSIVVTYINPDNPLDIVRRAFPYSDVSTALTVTYHNFYSRGGDAVNAKSGEHFVLVTPGSVSPTAESGSKNWSIIPALNTREDSLRYVGTIIEASRAFKVELQIYSNLGQFVNKIEFSLTQNDFAKLAKGVRNNTRQIRVLWDNYAADGSRAGTGAYIFKTKVTLLKLDGIAEDEEVSTDYRVMGVLRGP
ncbi:MAG: VWA domain-containing protein [Fibrobacteria bacterium]